MSYIDLKKLIYIGETVLGVLLLVLALHQLHLASVSADPLSNAITAAILFAVSTACLVFGIDTFILREDPDVWR